MASTINASNSGSGGLISAGDASGVLALQTGGTTAITVDTSQNVLIGTTSVGAWGVTPKLTIKQSSTSGAAGYVAFSSANDNATYFGYDGTNSVGTIGVSYSSSGSYTPLTFYTGGSERMRIDTSGNLLVATTSPTYGGVGSCRSTFVSPTSGGAGLFYTNYSGDVSTSCLNIGKYDNNNTSSQIFVKFAINSAGLGSGQINANGSGAATFASFSDSRLKNNIVDLPSQLANIMALRPVEYDYIESEGGGHQIGFVAQEVKEIYPDLVGERADGMYTLSDMNKNDARLIKCIQEMKTLIDTQAETINALTARIVALEQR